MDTEIGSGENYRSLAQVFSPVPVVDSKDLLIQEYFGNVASKQPSLSACVVTVKVCTVSNTKHAYQSYRCVESSTILIRSCAQICIEPKAPCSEAFQRPCFNE